MTETYIDTSEVAADMVDTWSALVTAAFTEKYGAQAGRDLQSQTDLLRTTLMDLLEQSRRVVVREGAIVAVDDVPQKTIDEINEIEQETP